MRCPNPDCREIFQVKSVGEPLAPPEPEPPRQPTSKLVDEFIPVIEAEPVKPPVIPPRPQRSSVVPVQAVVVEAKVVEAVIVDATPAVREVVWTPGAEVPVPANAGEPREPVPEAEAFVPRRRKKAKRWPAYALIGMVGAVVLTALYIGLTVLRNQSLAETQLAEQADAEYQAGNYSAAAKAFDQLAAEYPGQEESKRYEFLAALSRLQRDGRSAGTRENPTEVVAKLLAFIESHQDSPLSKSGEGGYGADLVELGRKLANDTADHIDDRLKAFRNDRSHPEELERAEAAIASGRDFLQKLEPHRAPEAPPFDAVRVRLDAAEREVTAGRKWLRVTTELRTLLARPTDRNVEEAKARLAASGLGGDAEAVQIVRDAEALLGRQVRFEPSPAPAQKPPTDFAGSLAFVAPIGDTIPFNRILGQAPETFLAVARGLVYAFDVDTGEPLWVARVGADVTHVPTVATLDLGGGHAGLAIVLSTAGGTPSVAAHDLRTGELRWSQSLPGAPAGPALVVDNRGFIPIRDESGTLVEIDLTTGERVGALVLAQPFGPPPVLRPGSNLIYAVADARRIYVINAALRDAEGNRAGPRCVQVLTTGHLPGSVRFAPLLLGPPGEATADRGMLLARIATLRTMQLDVLPLPAVPPPSADGLLPPGVAVAPIASENLPGWLTFPPASNGERIALALDTGEVRLFGVNQPGNRDRVLFPLPSPEFVAGNHQDIFPGVVLPADGATFWSLTRGSALQGVSLGIDPVKGFTVTVQPHESDSKKATLMGLPLNPPQVAEQSRAVLFVVQDEAGPGCRAVAIDRTTGAVHWQRSLGLQASRVAKGNTGLTLAGNAGACAVLPGSLSLPRAGQVKLMPALLPGDTAKGPAGRAIAAASEDGSILHSLLPIRVEDTPSVAVRRIVNGRVDRDGLARSDAIPAGEAIAFGDTVAFPATDGFVYRVSWKPKKAETVNEGPKFSPVIEPGPRWRTNDNLRDARCFLVALGPDRLAITDGERTLTTWLWRKDEAAEPGGATWSLTGSIAVTPLFLPGATGEPARLLMADINGELSLFAADRAGEPLRRWRPDGKSIPMGKPTSDFGMQPGAFGGSSVVYTVAGQHVVTLDPDSDKAQWVFKGDGTVERTIVGTPQAAGQGSWLITDLGGRVLRLNLANGQVAVAGRVGLVGVVPVAAGVPVEPFGILVPLSDGSVAVLDTTAPIREP